MPKRPYTIEMPDWPPPPFAEPSGNPRSRTRALLDGLSNPQRKLPPVVHIAGTNGKGSTLAFLRAILEAAGYKVHAYTSPHLKHLRERITLAGKPIDDSYLNELLNRVRMAAESPLPLGERVRVRGGADRHNRPNNPSPAAASPASGGASLATSPSRGEAASPKFFEAITAAAMLAFAENPADILLVEAGMGGLMDATNIFDEPLLTVITPISADHLEFLGPTLTQVAQHKAGILRPGVACATGPQPPEAFAALQAMSLQVGAALHAFGRDWTSRRDEDGNLEFTDDDNGFALPPPGLIGPHQFINAGTAIAAASLLDGFDISGDDLVAGLQNARWPGRLERIERGALFRVLETWSYGGLEASSNPKLQSSKTPELWFDGGHNPAAAEMLAELAATDWNDGLPLYVIFGTTEGKPLAPMLAPLAGRAARFYGIPVQAEPGAYGAAKVTQAALAAGLPAQEALTVEDAIRDLLASGAEPGRILIWGSLYLWVEAAGD